MYTVAPGGVEFKCISLCYIIFFQTREAYLFNVSRTRNRFGNLHSAPAIIIIIIIISSPFDRTYTREKYRIEKYQKKKIDKRFIVRFPLTTRSISSDTTAVPIRRRKQNTKNDCARAAVSDGTRSR